MLFSQSLAVSHLSGILNHMKHSVNDYRINSQKHQQTVICLNRTFATLLLKDFIHFFSLLEICISLEENSAVFSPWFCHSEVL